MSSHYLHGNTQVGLSIVIITLLFLAHELRAWLLHYSPFVLYGLIDKDYYEHHLLFVEAIYLLLKDVVSTCDIKQSSLLLNKYCYLFSTLYGKSSYKYTYLTYANKRHIYSLYIGKRHMSANVHSMLHLPEVVKDLGPLFANSCFPYETANGDILKLFHGSQGVEKQVT